MPCHAMPCRAGGPLEEWPSHCSEPLHHPENRIELLQYLQSSSHLISSRTFAPASHLMHPGACHLEMCLNMFEFLCVS